MKVLFFTEGHTPATRFRVTQFLPYLREHNIHGTVSYFRDDKFPLGGLNGGISYRIAARDIAKRCMEVLTAARYDAIFLQRDLLPWDSDILEQVAAALNKRVIFDFDDAIYLSSTIDSSAREWKIRRILQRVRLATVANPTLERFAANWAETVVVPMAVDTDLFVPSDAHFNGRKVRIGWVGTPTNFHHLRQLMDTLAMFGSQENVECVAMTSGGVIPELAGLPIHVEPWSESGECAFLKTLDIGLLPLLNTPLAQGKFPIKLLQYMAVGAVPVCSPVGVVTQVIEDGMNGVIVGANNDWNHALRRLINDSGLRRRLGIAARCTVEQRFSIHAVMPILLEVFDTVCR